MRIAEPGRGPWYPASADWEAQAAPRWWPVQLLAGQEGVIDIQPFQDIRMRASVVWLTMTLQA